MNRQEVEARRQRAAAEIARLDDLLTKTAQEIGRLQQAERDLQHQRRNAQAQIREAEWLWTTSAGPQSKLTISAGPQGKPPPSFITIKEFWQRLGKSKTWYTRHKRDPGFPKARQFGNSRPVLPLDEVEAYIATKMGKPKPKKEDQPAKIERRVGRPVGMPKRRKIEVEE
ncbi:helix-turn-helix transcriptional regulator [Mesorhizobium captivum]|uniref:helix-turn-helix transcriptional regulator n=1 Tax=Mesorhizobium captivum TaxID=3072319 RepID=UPI002A23FBBD|nr:hypothetical protein [Mesorhizobium sp. VK3C]MDX8445340.1 hypothetical protein [Mesorhizobium sp. VK3C]